MRIYYKLPIALVCALGLSRCGSGLCLEANLCGGGDALLAVSGSTTLGTRGFSTTTDVILIVSNQGSGTAVELSATAPTSPFSFVGGAYPGNGGSCASALGPGESCNLVVRFTSPTPKASHADTISLTYFDGSQSKELAINLSANSDNGTLVRARGFDGVVTSMASAGSRLIVGGQFRHGPGQAADYVAVLKDDLSIDADLTPTDSKDNYVTTVVANPSVPGGYYVGGYFSSWGGASIYRLARVDAAGDRDTSFNIGTGFFLGVVDSVATALDGSGDVYAVGSYRTFNGVTVNGVVRLNSNGTRDAAFATGTGFGVGGFPFGLPTVVLPASDGSFDVYVGGVFDSFNGVGGNNHIIRLNSNGSRDAGFAVGIGFDNTVLALTQVADGSQIYVGGAFDSFNGISGLGGIIRLLANGSRDGAFATGTGFGGDSSISVSELLLSADGSGLYVGGEFTTFNGTVAQRLVRLTSNGALDTSFAIGSGFDAEVNALAFAPDSSGDLIVGGRFTSYQGTPVNRIVRLRTDGTLVSLESVSRSGFNWGVDTILPVGDGSGDIYCSGSFSSYSGTRHSGITRLTSEGIINPTFDPGDGFSPSGQIKLVSVSDGSGDIYAAGWFSEYRGSPQGHIVRLRPDGTVSPQFNSGSGFNNHVTALALANDVSGDIYVGGWFNDYNGTTTNRIARINADGTLDSAFAIGTGFTASEFVDAIAPAVDGTGDVYVGGSFTTYNGVPGITRIVRLNSDGSIDGGFASGTGFNNTVEVIVPALDGSGDVYIGGAFTSYSGTLNVNRLVRLNSDGTIDSGFAVGTGMDGSWVYSLLLSAESNELLVGGDFTTFNGISGVAGVVKLRSDGTRNDSFSTGSGVTGGSISVFAEASDGSGDIYMGGSFGSFNGNITNYFLRISENGTPDLNEN